LPASGVEAQDFAGNPIAGFPEIVAQAGADLEAPLSRARGVSLTAGIDVRHVGRIYLDNSGNAANSTDPSTVVNLRCGVTAGGLGLGRRFSVELLVNNLTNELYATSGYTYYGEAYYYPAAERNYYLRIRTGW